MRAFALICLCLAVAGQVQAAPVTPVAAGPLTWPNRGPYQRVGRDDRGLGIIKLPVPVVAAVQRLVPNDPFRWSLIPGLQDFAGHGWQIVEVVSEAGYVTLLKARGRWTLLSAPESLPVLNEVLDPLTPADLQNRKKTHTYLDHIMLLQKPEEGTFLDAQFRHGELDNPEVTWWHQKNETTRRALRALCHDPVVTRAGDRVTVRLNFLTMSGAVERWTFHLRLDKTVRLEGTDVLILRKKGTFFHPV